MYVEYSHNNSGGVWWLTDEDWRALEADGWEVDWYANRDDGWASDRDGRFLGALASSATLQGATSLIEAKERWERITGQCSTDAGCPCCGQPHRFTLYDDNDKHIDSGPEIDYSARW